jgi:hypothetical protein
VTAAAFDRLASSDDQTLDKLFASSPPPVFDALVGYRWRGYNTDPNLRYLGLKKFIKAFFRAEHGDEGCNIKVFQDAITEPWRPRTRRGKIDAFAFYLVRPQSARTRLARNGSALLIDYGASSRNPIYHVERTILDYLVQPFAEDPDVMLGRAFVGFGRMRMASSFFVLHRDAPFVWPV